MSTFGSKRKARKITIRNDDDEDDASDRSTTSLAPLEPLSAPEPEQEPALQATFKTRKPKQSALRRSTRVDDEDDPATKSARQTDQGGSGEQDNGAGGDDEDDTSLRIRLAKGASASKPRRRMPTSRLSFGPSEPGEDGGAEDGGSGAGEGDDGEDSLMLGAETPFTPKKSSLLAHAAAGSSNAGKKKGRKSGLARNLPLPMRPTERDDNDSDDGRPRYSKEYLSELQSSTPNTPRDLSARHADVETDADLGLDPSELEGATVVLDDETAGRAPPQHAADPAPSVLSEAQVAERKARRARLAAEQGGGGGSGDTDDFISLEDDDAGGSNRRNHGDSYLSVLSRQSQQVSVSSRRQPGKPDGSSRLVREDEDLGEGFDAFVEDGGLSLGARAERDARRRQRAEMGDLIAKAEGHHGNAAGGAGDDDGGASSSDESEAERRAAYEASQTRAGMDGLAAEREAQRRRMGGARGAAALPPPRITPLPDLSVLAAAFEARVRAREAEAASVREALARLRADRAEAERREPEVQRLLDQAGERYRALMGGGDGGPATAGEGEGGERGLESLGATPVRGGGDVEMEMGA